MARMNAPGVSDINTVLAALVSLGIVPNPLLVGTRSTPTTPAPPPSPVARTPVIIIEDDEDDDGTSATVADDRGDEPSQASGDGGDEPRAAPVAPSCLHCPVCGTNFELTRMRSGQPYHVVFVGRRPGIYKSFAHADAQVLGVSGGKRKRFPDVTTAISAYQLARSKGEVIVRFGKADDPARFTEAD